MTNSQFPSYSSAEIGARWGCLHCLKPLNPENVRDDGYADGRGRYCIKCEHCQMSTWFDLWDKLGNSIKEV